MIPPRAPIAEAARLLDLARYGILDTPAEAEYDRIVRLTARVLGVPVAALNFVDEGRHWHKAAYGMPRGEYPLPEAPCAWTVAQDTPMTVPDLALDPRFGDLPVVHAGMRMYAGAPLITPRGHHIGTLCVFDTAPRPLPPEDLQALEDLAALVVTALELRRHAAELDRQLGAQNLYAAELQRELNNAQTLEAVTALGNMNGTPEEIAFHAAQLLGQAMGADWTGLVTVRGEAAQGEAVQVHLVQAAPGFSPRLGELLEEARRQGSGVITTLHGAEHNVYIDHYGAHPAALPGAAALGLRSVAWVPLGMWGDYRAALLVLRAGGEERRPWRAGDRALLEAAGRSIRNALQRQAALEVVTRISRQDALTGVGNRRALEEALDGAGPDQTWTAALLDLDGFKALNDEAGHAEGDKALRVFAGALAAEFALDAQVYRLGGDEFVLLLPELCAEPELLDRIDLAVLAARQVAPTPLGVSVGTATTRDAAPADLLALADHRMYAVKRRRKARNAAAGVEAGA